MHRRLGFVRSGWFRLFLGGLALLLLVMWALASTGDPIYVPSVLLLGAFLVPVTLVAYLYERTPVSDVPLATVAICFLWGGALGTVIAGLLEYRTLRSLGPLGLLGVGVIEEGAKLAVPLALYLRGRYRSEADGLLFGVAAGMGFAALETMGYGFVALLQSRGSLGALELTLLGRGLFSPAGHAAWTGLVCGVLWRERARRGHPALDRAVVGALVVAVLLHTLWDLLNSLSGGTLLATIALQLLSFGVALISLALLIWLLRAARRAGAALESGATRVLPIVPLGAAIAE